MTRSIRFEARGRTGEQYLGGGVEPLESGDPGRVGPYSILGVLGDGSVGKVYLGRSAGGHLVAVKRVRAELADDPGFRVRFREVVESAKAVSGAFTAAVVDADTESSVPWVATTYIAGVSLDSAVARHGPLPEAMLRTLAVGLAEALSGIHRAGVFHRNLNPSNVLLVWDGPYITGFGSAHAIDGTTDQRVGPESDMFCLGLVLVYAAVGRSPSGNDLSHALPHREAGTEPDLTGVPEPLRAVVAALLDEDPKRRPTPQQIIDQLDAYAPTSTTGSWLPSSLTADIMTMNAVLAGAAMPCSDRVPGGSVAPPRLHSGWVGEPGPQAGHGPGSDFPAATEKMGRRSLLGLLGVGAAMLGGGAVAAVAAASPRRGTVVGPQSTPEFPPATEPDWDPSTIVYCGVESDGKPIPAGCPSPDFTPPIGPAPTSPLGPQAVTAWVAQTADDIRGATFAGNTLLLIGTNETHGLDTSGHPRWPDIASGSGDRIGKMVLTAASGDTVYTSLRDDTGATSAIAIDVTTGRTLWATRLPAADWQADGAAGVIGKQVIYTGGRDGQVMAVDVDSHRILWSQTGKIPIEVTVPTSGKYIFTLDGAGLINALDVTNGGMKAWSSSTNAQLGIALCMAGGKVIYGGEDVTALDVNTGEIVWQTSLYVDKGGATGPPFTDGAGRVYVTSENLVFAISAETGGVAWKWVAPSTTFFGAGPLAIADGYVYAIDSSGVMFAIDAASGTMNWTYPGAVNGDTLTAGGGKVYFTSGRAVTALNAAGN